MFHSASSYGRFLELQAVAALRIGADSLEGGIIIPAETLSDSGGAKALASDADNYQNDPSMAISRKNPSIVAVGANDHRMSNLGMPCYFSSDTGHTWKTTFLPTEFGTQALGDPVLAYHIDGTLYYAYMRAEVGLQNDNIMVAVSTDGETWKSGTPVIPTDSLSGYEDKEFICVDRSIYTPHPGRVYAVWTHYDTNGVTGSVRIAWSDNACQTWALPKSISPDLGHFCEVKTGKFGEIIVGYSVEKDSLSGTHWLAVSTDGGKSFTKRFVSNYTVYPANKNGYPSLKGEAGFRCYPYMSFAVNLFTDQLHVVYGDCFVGGKVSMLYYVSSPNLGASWSFPYAIGYDGKIPTDTTLRDRFCPWVSVNQLTGAAFATYYSSEKDLMNVRSAVYRVELDYSGSSHPVMLSAAEFDPLEVKNSPAKLPFIGDYITSDVFDPVYASAWTEGNPNSHVGNIFGHVLVQYQPSSAPLANRLQAVELLRSISPNPVTGQSVSVVIHSKIGGPARLSLVDATGKTVAELWHGTLADDTDEEVRCELAAVAAGAYLLRVETPSGDDDQWISIQ